MIRQTKRSPVTPICIECGGLGRMTPGSLAYPRRPDLHQKFFFVCPCGARVGCHPGTGIALGLPCGPETARLRDRAHRAFDRIWKARVAAGARRERARSSAYIWLAKELGLTRDEAHISRMDQATCRRVIELCRAASAESVRA